MDDESISESHGDWSEFFSWSNKANLWSHILALWHSSEVFNVIIFLLSDLCFISVSFSTSATDQMSILQILVFRQIYFHFNCSIFANCDDVLFYGPRLSLI